MKHGNAHRILGRESAERWMLFRNLVTELIKHDRIRTTLPKAKEVKRLADQVRANATASPRHAPQRHGLTARSGALARGRLRHRAQVVTLGKRGDLHARRQAAAIITARRGCVEAAPGPPHRLTCRRAQTPAVRPWSWSGARGGEEAVL